MKMTVLYHSKSGNTKRMAGHIVEGMEAAGEVEARSFGIGEADADFVRASRCVVLGTPTHLATFSAAVKAWLDESARGYGLAGKVGGAFATADYVHGGAEVAIQAILAHFMVLGMLVYSGGGSFGKPVIHFGPVATTDRLEEYGDVFRPYGTRMATKALELFG